MGDAAQTNGPSSQAVAPIDTESEAAEILVPRRTDGGGGRVSLVGVTKRFGDVVAVDDLTLEITDQEFLVLLGPSGCGKSTVLRLIAGLEEPDEGTIEIGDYTVNDIDPKDRDLAMVFQSYALYPQMSVARNIEFPLRARNVQKVERERLVLESARMLGLDELLERRPAQLSGGQRQRVALARAVVRRPKAFLMDEPLSNLDAKLRVQTRAELADLHRRLATTVIYVTHDQSEAMTLGQRIAVMNEGRLLQVDPPQMVYDRPANLFVARFIGSPPMCTIDGRLASENGGAVVELPGGHLPVPDATMSAVSGDGRREVVVGIRPEHLLVRPEGSLPATVAVIESLGHEQHVLCRLADQTVVVARVPSDQSAPAAGENVRLAAVEGHLHFFDPDNGTRIDA